MDGNGETRIIITATLEGLGPIQGEAPITP
jgi:hypothetical protein